MGDSVQEGSVVIVDTGQAGTVVQLMTESTWVLLRNGDIWVGLLKLVNIPQSQEHLDSCPTEVDRFEDRKVCRSE